MRITALLALGLLLTGCENFSQKAKDAALVAAGIAAAALAVAYVRDGNERDECERERDRTIEYCLARGYNIAYCERTAHEYHDCD